MKITPNSVIEFVRSDTYTGVLIDGEPLKQSTVRHSPDGFNFGYGGSGPADLALNILLLICSRRIADELHQSFKWKFITPAQEGDTISGSLILDFVTLEIHRLHTT